MNPSPPNRYPFIVRTPVKGGRRLHKVIIAPSYKDALGLILMRYPGKKVNTKQARYMVLMEAKVEAAKASRTEHKGKTVYINVEPDGECVIALEADNTTHAAYKNGSEIAIPVEAATVENKPTPKVKKSARKLTAINEDGSTDAEPKTKASTIKKKSKMSTTKVKKAPAAKKAAKKSKTESRGATIPRGNNMHLTAGEWAKVDAILKKEGASWAAWVRGLVQAKIK